MKTTLTFNRDTKSTFVFKNDDDGAPIPSLYVKKDAFPDGEAPKTITVDSPEATGKKKKP